MERFLVAWLLAALLLGQAAFAQGPPESELPPDPDFEEDVYKPPAAWKSVEIGNYYLKKKNYPGAMSRFKEAIATDPHYPDGYLGAGKVYDRLGFPEKALDAYRTYLDLLPSTEDALQAKSVRKRVARLEKVVAAAKHPASGSPVKR